jgi:carboxyl-terminal processing protease
MKKLLAFLTIILAAHLFTGTSVINRHTDAAYGDSLFILKPENYHSQEEQLISTILARYHYKKIKFNDSLSSVIFDRYIKSLDNHKMYFLASDIKEFEGYRYSFDEYFQEGHLTPAYDMFNRFAQRVDERILFGINILEKEMDFTIQEELEIDREDSVWPETSNEANEYWRKRVKNDALNLKIAGKDWKSIAETLNKRYENLRRNIVQYKSEDVFQLIMNAYTESIDPHSNYLSPFTSENFKMNMNLSLEGIGAQLQSDDEYTKINEIIVGGPAYKSGLLKKGDRIVGVAQESGEMVDVIGWRLNDVVQLIRGPKGTSVRLQILPADQLNPTIKEITLVRDKVKLEEQSAKKQILEIEESGKPFRIGVISIPAFYSNFEDQQKGIKDFKSTTRDVKLLLDTLKKEGVDGVVIDLRNNGGGALSEAIQLTGLFIDQGPVVQVRNADGTIEVGEDLENGMAYNGPLVVLVNRFSASASEIFSGAIQDYGRGLIIGEQTYGKGTVQNLIDLNRLMRISDKELGQVKITIAKYYRVNGESTQHLGVIPDITFPSYFDDPKEYGESSEPSALPWDTIRSSSYSKVENLKSFIEELKSRHEARIQTNTEFENLLEDISEYKSNRNKKTVSLNEETRLKEKAVEEELKIARENERRTSLGLKLLDKGEVPVENDEDRDPILDEAARILSDYLMLSIG